MSTPTYDTEIVSMAEPAVHGNVALSLCSECGAWVGAQVLHTDWHARLAGSEAP